jgi:hypothetical protein
MQKLLSTKKINELSKKHEYEKSSRKIGIKELIMYFTIIALTQCKSYREAAQCVPANYELPCVDYSELSKKAKEVPYEIVKEIFEEMMSHLNNKMKRAPKQLKNIRKSILAIDSTTITTSKTQMKWAEFHGQSAGVKLHVRFNVDSYMPTAVTESVARSHDSNYADELTDETSVLVEDRAYSKAERFDKYLYDNQDFVIRIKENLTKVQSRNLKRLPEEDSSIISDITCKLGKDKKCTENRFRVVGFYDNKNNKIEVCTNLMNINAETIAEIYKTRWTIETFFRFIKQNLNLSKIFGTSKNAVFNQLYSALIAFIVVRYMYIEMISKVKFKKLTMIQFLRCLRLNVFSDEVYVAVISVVKNLLSPFLVLWN